MKKLGIIVILLLVSSFISGCGKVTIPVDAYQPQNYVRFDGNAALGDFLYQPFIDKKVASPNHLRSTALGTILLSMDVSEFVKKATALELEKTGIIINPSSNYMIGANILEFTVDDLGYSADLIYSVKYIIKDKSGAVLFDKVFSPDKVLMSKFNIAGLPGPIFSGIVAKGYDMFIADPQVRSLLGVTPKK